MLTPSQPHSTLPLSASCGSSPFTRLIGMAKPIDPLRAAMLLTPITSPAMLTSGPPELPGLIAASVWMKSKPGAATSQRGAFPAHDAEGDRLLEPEGMAQRQHQLADAEAVRIPEVGDRQARRLDLDQGQVHPVVLADEASFEAAAVGELHLDALGIAHDVGIRHQIAVLPDEEARSRGAAPFRRAALALARALDGAVDAHLHQERLEPLGEVVQEVIEPRDVGRRRRVRLLLPQALRRLGGCHGDRREQNEDCHCREDPPPTTAHLHDHASSARTALFVGTRARPERQYTVRRKIDLYQRLEEIARIGERRQAEIAARTA